MAGYMEEESLQSDFQALTIANTMAERIFASAFPSSVTTLHRHRVLGVAAVPIIAWQCEVLDRWANGIWFDFMSEYCIIL